MAVACPRRIRIAEVARAAGVARSTAALALRGSPALREETRRRVAEAAAALGYVYDRAAARLRSGRSHTVGLVLPNIANPFYAELVAGIDAALDDAGYVALLVSTAESPERQARVLARLREHGVDGVILSPAEGTPAALLDRLAAWGLPHVQAVRAFRRGACVRADDRRGARLAAEHLIRLGHRRIALLGGAADTPVARDRLAGWRGALAAAGLAAAEHVPTPAGDRAAAAEAAAALTLRRPEVTALLCLSDTVAIGAMLGLRRAGREPGRDVAVVGFDDVPEAALWRPALTTVAVGAREIGAAAAALLLARVADPAAPARRIALPPRLVVRQSCGAPTAVEAAAGGSGG